VTTIVTGAVWAETLIGASARLTQKAKRCHSFFG